MAPVYYGGTPTSSSGYQSSSKRKPPPRGAGGPGVNVQAPTGNTTASSGRTDSGSDSTTTTTTGGSPQRSVAYPNFGYYVSSGDAYGGRNPADPSLGAWNVGLTKDDALAMWDSGDFSPELIAYLDAVAYEQHPMKKGKTLWKEAVDAAYAVNNRGDFRTAWSLLSSKYLDSSPEQTTPDGDPGSYPTGSGSGSYGGGGGGGGGSVSLTNPTSARGLLMQTMQSVLGRNPTNDEYKTFLQVLNEAEMANPNTASFEGGMAVGSGGVDPGVLALEFAQDQEDFQERQGDNYFRTFMQALAGGV